MLAAQLKARDERALAKLNSILENIHEELSLGGYGLLPLPRVDDDEEQVAHKEGEWAQREPEPKWGAKKDEVGAGRSPV